MKLADVPAVVEGTLLITPSDRDRQISGGYASDLLSCAMARAGVGNLWVTMQIHANIVAVAVLLDLAGIVISECEDIAKIEPATLEKAREEKVAIIATPLTTYSAVARLAAAGLPGVEEA